MRPLRRTMHETAAVRAALHASQFAVVRASEFAVMRDAILFDCDGVLVNSEELVIEIERELLADLGLAYEHEEFLTRFLGISDADYITLLRRDHDERGRHTFPEDFLERARARALDAFAHRLRAVEGVAEFLARLRLPRAVASSSSLPLLQHKLRLTGLSPWFGKHVYSAEHVDRGKPAPDLFLLAAGRLAVPPRDCVVIEDSVLGVRAGAAAGMEVWGFTGGGHADAALGDRLRDAGARRVFARFDRLEAAL